MRRLFLLLLGAVSALGCDDPALQDFVQEHGAAQASVVCTIAPSSGYSIGRQRYQATLFWDGSVSAHTDGVFGIGSVYNPRGSGNADDRRVDASYWATVDSCGAGPVEYVDRTTLHIDGDELVLSRDFEPNDGCHVDVEHARTALSSCSGFSIEAFEN